MEDRKMTSTKSPGKCRQMVRFSYRHHHGHWEQYWHQAHIPISFIKYSPVDHMDLRIASIYDSVGVPVRGIRLGGGCAMRRLGGLWGEFRWHVGIPVRGFLTWVHIGRPMLHRGGAIPWAEPGTKDERVSWALACVHSLLSVPDGGCNVTSSLRLLLLLWHPCCDGLWLLL